MQFDRKLRNRRNESREGVLKKRHKAVTEGYGEKIKRERGRKRKRAGFYFNNDERGRQTRGGGWGVLSTWN